MPKPTRPTVNAIVPNGFVPVIHVDNAMKYTFALVPLSGKTVATSVFEVPRSLVVGTEFRTSFGQFKLKRFSKIEPGTYTIRVVAQSSSLEDSDPTEQTITLSAKDAKELQRSLIKPFPFVPVVPAIIGVIILAAIVAGAIWFGKSQGSSNTAGDSPRIGDLERELHVMKIDQTNQMARREQLEKERDELEAKAKAAATTPASNALPDATAIDTNQPAGTEGSTQTSSTNASTRTQGRSDIKLSSQLTIPAGTKMKTGSPTVTGNNQVVGNIFNAPVSILFNGSEAPSHVHKTEDKGCVKTGWLGENRPTTMCVIPHGVAHGETNIMVEHGKKVMVVLPAHLTLFPDVNDAERFIIKYGDDCGKQGDYSSDPFAPCRVMPPQVHGYIRVLIEHKKDKKGGWFSNNKFFNFSFGPSSRAAKNP